MSVEHAVFAHPEFSPNEYANAILAGEPYPPQDNKTNVIRPAIFEPANEDVSVTISKLTFGIDDVEKQLKNVVTAHHEELLVQAAGVTDLEGSLSSVRHGLTDLDVSFEKLRSKIRIPYQSLQAHVSNMERLQQATDILRRTSRFILLTRRLEVQLAEMNKNESSESAESITVPKVLTGSTSHAVSADPSMVSIEIEDDKERAIAKAALTISELTALLVAKSTDPVPGAELKDISEDKVPSDVGVSFSSVNAVAEHLGYIDAARNRITTDMEAMVITGLATLNQSLLASSLQTARNLGVLPELVHNLVTDLSDAVEDRIRSSFDLNRISKEVLAKDTAPASQTLLYKSRVRTEPTNLTAPQWIAALWSSLESLIEEMADCCIKVYTLEKVLRLKRDPITQVVFLDEAMKTLENKPSSIFWSALGQSLEKYSRDSARASTFLQQTLSSGYPRLLRLFHSFFAKIAVQTDTIYTHSQQSPETVLVLKALSNFESLYLSRSANRMNEAVGQAFGGGARSPPGMTEGINISRTIVNELDSAKFDPLLVRSVARYVISSLDMLLSRMQSMVAKERSAVSLLGPVATPQQILNGQLATCLWHCWSRLDKLQDELPEAVLAIIKPNIANMQRDLQRIIDPLLASVRRELSAIIAKLHRMDFSISVDPMNAMSGGASPYMKDLVEKLNFIKSDILSQYSTPDLTRQCAIDIVRFTIKTFVLHASIANPLGETGKLQLISDMTELEFGLNAFMADKGASKRGVTWDVIGDDYRALRAMRQLLFLDNTQLTSPKHTIGLPPLIVLHHILVRSPIPLPHSLHGWAEAEYVRWVEEHSEEEAWTLVEGDLVHWEQVAKAEGADTAAASEFVQLARMVLSNSVKDKS